MFDLDSDAVIKHLLLGKMEYFNLIEPVTADVYGVCDTAKIKLACLHFK